MSGLVSVYDKQGSERQLGELLAQGGEGKIFPLKERPEILVKCYHADVLQKHGLLLQAKVEAMIGIKNNFKSHSVCWPQMCVFSNRDSKVWIGFAMKRAQGVRMNKLAHAMAYKSSFPNLNRLNVSEYLISFLNAIKSLHAVNVRIGDYNLNNIMCVPGDTTVSLIDCDSYQIKSNGTLYHCPVGSPDMTPKEHHGKSFSEIVRTDASERFSVAIILFKCLMLGRHPYDIVGGDDPVSNLKIGKFAYGSGNSGVPLGPWYNIWSHMPHRLKNLFIVTFTEGATIVSKRPSIEEWLEALDIYCAEMRKGWHETALKPQHPKSKSYRGNRSLN